MALNKAKVTAITLASLLVGSIAAVEMSGAIGGHTPWGPYWAYVSAKFAKFERENPNISSDDNYGIAYKVVREFVNRRGSGTLVALDNNGEAGGKAGGEDDGNPQARVGFYTFKYKECKSEDDSSTGDVVAVDWEAVNLFVNEICNKIKSKEFVGDLDLNDNDNISDSTDSMAEQIVSQYKQYIGRVGKKDEYPNAAMAVVDLMYKDYEACKRAKKEFKGKVIVYRPTKYFGREEVPHDVPPPNVWVYVDSDGNSEWNHYEEYFDDGNTGWTMVRDDETNDDVILKELLEAFNAGKISAPVVKPVVKKGV